LIFLTDDSLTDETPQTWKTEYTFQDGSFTLKNVTRIVNAQVQTELEGVHSSLVSPQLVVKNKVFSKRKHPGESPKKPSRTKRPRSVSSAARDF
jgi:hypothetical protein